MRKGINQSSNKWFLTSTQTIGISLLMLVLALLTGCASIQTAAREGNLSHIKTLVALGVKVDSRHPFTVETPLIEAARNGRVEVVKFLIENGADINLQGEAWYAPLHCAAQNGHVKVVKILLENGAEVDRFSNKPLHRTAEIGNIEIAEILLAYGADINTEKGRGFTPLHVAAGWGQAEMVRYLLVRGANVNPTTGEGITPLHRAAGSDRVEVGRILLEHGAVVPSGGNARPLPIRSDQFRKLLQQYETNQSR